MLKGHRIKTRKRRPVKPGFKQGQKTSDPLGHLPLLRYMDLHFEAMLVTGYSASTVRSHREALRRFIAWCAERDLSQPHDITKPILERYQRQLFYYRKPDGAPLTTGSQAQKLAPLKTWFKWLARENHILSNPASELQMPKMPKRLPGLILSAQEVEAILAEADPNNAQGLRDRAMLEVLYSTGLRRMEMVGLACHDVDLNRQLVFVREGKGRRDRVVPLGARAAAWVDKYLIEARPQLLTTDTAALFVTDYGEAITARLVAAKVKRYMEFAGIKKPGATHLLRHACATHMLEGGADIRFIQAMLGHAKLDTTEIYTHVSIDKLQQIHAATHPARLQRRQDAQTATASPNLDGDVQALLDAIGDETDEGEAI